jgi:hypothetical protein
LSGTRQQALNEIAFERPTATQTPFAPPVQIPYSTNLGTTNTYADSFYVPASAAFAGRASQQPEINVQSFKGVGGAELSLVPPAGSLAPDLQIPSGLTTGRTSTNVALQAGESSLINPFLTSTRTPSTNIINVPDSAVQLFDLPTGSLKNPFQPFLDIGNVKLRPALTGAVDTAYDLGAGLIGGVVRGVPKSLLLGENYLLGFVPPSKLVSASQQVTGFITKNAPQISPSPYEENFLSYIRPKIEKQLSTEKGFSDPDIQITALTGLALATSGLGVIGEIGLGTIPLVSGAATIPVISSLALIPASQKASQLGEAYKTAPGTTFQEKVSSPEVQYQAGGFGTSVAFALAPEGYNLLVTPTKVKPVGTPQQFSFTTGKLTTTPVRVSDVSDVFTQEQGNLLVGAKYKLEPETLIATKQVGQPVNFLGIPIGKPISQTSFGRATGPLTGFGQGGRATLQGDIYFQRLFPDYSQLKTGPNLVVKSAPDYSTLFPELQPRLEKVGAGEKTLDYVGISYPKVPTEIKPPISSFPSLEGLGSPYKAGQRVANVVITPEGKINIVSEEVLRQPYFGGLTRGQPGQLLPLLTTKEGPTLAETPGGEFNLREEGRTLPTRGTETRIKTFTLGENVDDTALNFISAKFAQTGQDLIPRQRPFFTSTQARQAANVPTGEATGVSLQFNKLIGEQQKGDTTVQYFQAFERTQPTKGTNIEPQFKLQGLENYLPTKFTKGRYTTESGKDLFQPYTETEGYNVLFPKRGGTTITEPTAPAAQAETSSNVPFETTGGLDRNALQIFGQRIKTTQTGPRSLFEPEQFGVDTSLGSGVRGIKLSGPAVENLGGRLRGNIEIPGSESAVGPLPPSTVFGQPSTQRNRVVPSVSVDILSGTGQDQGVGQRGIVSQIDKQINLVGQVQPIISITNQDIIPIVRTDQTQVQTPAQQQVTEQITQPINQPPVVPIVPPPFVPFSFSPLPPNFGGPIFGGGPFYERPEREIKEKKGKSTRRYVPSLFAETFNIVAKRVPRGSEVLGGGGEFGFGVRPLIEGGLKRGKASKEERRELKNIKSVKSSLGRALGGNFGRRGR